jgi:hypothetical protein
MTEQAVTRERRRDVLLKWLVFFGALAILLAGTVLYEYWMAAPSIET